MGLGMLFLRDPATIYQRALAVGFSRGFEVAAGSGAATSTARKADEQAQFHETEEP